MPTLEKNDLSWLEYKGPTPLRIPGVRGSKPNQHVFHQPFVYLTFISAIGVTIDCRPTFVDPAKANSAKYVISANPNKFDSSNTGVDEPKIPPQKTMIADFKSNKQNYTDIKTMIEETRKRDNESFG